MEWNHRYDRRTGKVIVLFDKEFGASILSDNTAFLYPLNHPDKKHVSGTKPVITSKVIGSIWESGRLVQIETQNTVYRESE